MSLEAAITEAVKQAVAEALTPLLAKLSSQPQQTSARLAYTIREAAEITGTSENAIRTAIRQGELHAKQTSEGQTARYVIPADCLGAWLHGIRQPIDFKKAR